MFEVRSSSNLELSYSNLELRTSNFELSSARWKGSGTAVLTEIMPSDLE
jgi:hypothetical protein